MKLCSNKSRLKSGFSLVEMIVSIGIFAIVAVISLGALTKIVSANRKAQSIQNSVTNLNFALDAMSRELRVGSKYYCTSGNSFGLTVISTVTECDQLHDGATGALIAFNSSKRGTGCNLIYVYRLRPDSGSYVIEKATQSSCGASITESDYAPIMDPKIIVDGYYIDVSFRPGETTGFPLATIRLSGHSGIKEKEKSFFDVQTAISPRLN
jgi:prepilin-type N-terminal cleavage/methylation domain-containing protein